MTAPRPEDDTGLQGPYEQGAYGADGAFVAAVEGLADPLNDPLPVDGARPRAYGGPEQPQGAPNEWYDPEGYQRDWYAAQQAPAPVPAPAPDPGPRRVTVTPPVPDETLGLRTADTRRIVAEPRGSSMRLGDGATLPPSTELVVTAPGW
ncbi:hypothetical protein AB0F28_31915, partial [Streptomyces microflavus]